MKRAYQAMGAVALAVLALGGCASASGGGAKASTLMRFAAESGAIQYFFPMMQWKTEDKGDINATVDITYRYEAGSEAICNISFAAASKKGVVPPLPASAVFTAGGVEYPLSNITLLFSKPEELLLRITATLPGDDAVRLFQAQALSLTAVMEGKNCRYTPPKEFLRYRDLVLADMGLVR